MARNGQSTGVSNKIVEVDPNKVKPFDKQPREYFDEAAMIRLRASIDAIGQLTPAKIKKLKNGWQLVDGERRWRACKELGIKLRAEVVTVKNTSEQKIFSGVANFGREGHTPIEIARYIDWALQDSEVERRVKAQLLAENDGKLPGNRRRKNANKPTMTEKIAWLAQALGHSTAWIYEHLKLLKLDPSVQDKIRKKRSDETGLSQTFAMELAGAVPKDKKLQRKIADRVVTDGMKLRPARDYMHNEIARTGKLPGKTSGPGRRHTLSYNAKRIKSLVNRLETDADKLFELPDEDVLSALDEFDSEERELLKTKLSVGMQKLRGLQVKLSNVESKAKKNGRSTRASVAA